MFRHVWDWFLELSAQRGSGMAGAEPLKYADIHAWSVITAQPLAAHEARLIIQLDNIFADEMNKRRRREAKQNARRKR